MSPGYQPRQPSIAVQVPRWVSDPWVWLDAIEEIEREAEGRAPRVRDRMIWKAERSGFLYRPAPPKGVSGLATATPTIIER